MDDRHARYRRTAPDPRRRPMDGYRALNVRGFERLVDTALASLPAKFLAYMDNTEVVVEEVPPHDAFGRREGIPLGLYEGMPRTARVSGPPAVRDRITLYRRPIESRVTNKEDLLDLIREVVIHELAHHFGIDDDRFDEPGW